MPLICTLLLCVWIWFPHDFQASWVKLANNFMGYFDLYSPHFQESHLILSHLSSGLAVFLTLPFVSFYTGSVSRWFHPWPSCQDTQWANHFSKRVSNHSITVSPHTHVLEWNHCEIRYVWWSKLSQVSNTRKLCTLCEYQHGQMKIKLCELGHKKIGLSQKPARIGMITAHQRVGLRVGLKIKNNFYFF